MKAITEAGFQAAVLDTHGTVIVDYWAEWCGPCKLLTPILEEIGRQFPHVSIVSINVDDNPGLAINAGVTSIPTVEVYSNGSLVKTIIGAKPKAALLSELHAWL